MKTFKQFILDEDVVADAGNAAGAGGVFGDAPSMGHGGDFGNSDFYAPGDARIPVALGARRKGKKKKMLVQRRSLFKYF
jgi:hypothetical protein